MSRFRDHILRDEDIRKAGMEVVKIIYPEAELTYTEKTSGILATFLVSSLNLEKLQLLTPLALEIGPKVRFYTPQKKTGCS